MNNPTVIGKATLHNIDCMELLKATPDKFYELAIVDPPYGIGMGGGRLATVKLIINNFLGQISLFQRMIIFTNYNVLVKI